MNKLALFSILLLSTFSIQAQDTLTIGEVFDFEINDLFHSKNMISSVPPCGSKTLIIDKYYSPNYDTLYYRTHQVSYASTYYQTPQPHLKLDYYERFDTLVYTQLDSSIINLNTAVSDFFYSDTTKYCNTLVNGYLFGSKSKGCTQREFGKGLGQTKYMCYYAMPNTGEHSELVFYRKNGTSCGKYDTLCEFILNTPPTIEPIQFELYPNPATGHITLQSQNLSNNAVAFLYNQIGQHIRKFQLTDQKQRMDISALKPGIYFIEIRSKNLRKTQKLIIQ